MRPRLPLLGLLRAGVSLTRAILLAVGTLLRLGLYSLLFTSALVVLFFLVYAALCLVKAPLGVAAVLAVVVLVWSLSSAFLVVCCGVFACVAAAVAATFLRFSGTVGHFVGVPFATLARFLGFGAGVLSRLLVGPILSSSLPVAVGLLAKPIPTVAGALLRSVGVLGSLRLYFGLRPPLFRFVGGALARVNRVVGAARLLFTTATRPFVHVFWSPFVLAMFCYGRRFPAAARAGDRFLSSVRFFALRLLSVSLFVLGAPARPSFWAELSRLWGLARIGLVAYWLGQTRRCLWCSIVWPLVGLGLSALWGVSCFLDRHVGGASAGPGVDPALHAPVAFLI